jgi:hypothetical protein
VVHEHAAAARLANLLLLPAAGPSAVLRLQPGGKLQVKQLAEEQQQQEEDDSSWVKPEWGQYRQRGSVAGMPIMVRWGLKCSRIWCQQQLAQQLVAQFVVAAVCGCGATGGTGMSCLLLG